MAVTVLTAAALGLLAYGFYAIAWSVVDLVRGARLEVWAELGMIASGCCCR